ncbi:MAG: DUF86 domain-containing protein [Candidatus Shapirobacteria bacterium]
MIKDPKIFLGHILDSITEIENTLKSVSEKDFSQNVQAQDAVIRRIEIIGEATKNLPITITKRYPKIEWREIAGMRDKLIHQYFGVDVKIVWETAKKDIPKLKRQISKVLENEG